MSDVREFHAHIYFDAGELAEARGLADRAHALFGVAIGRFHEKPIGPHPRGSCQLTVSTGIFGAFASWAALNRDGLTIFAHADTGEDLIDHSRNVIWFGPSEALDLTVFESPSGEPPPA